jgi:hypothetical protein
MATTRWSAIETGAAEPSPTEMTAVTLALGMTVSQLAAEIAASRVPRSEAEAWFDERIRYSLLVRHIGAARATSR